MELQNVKNILKQIDKSPYAKTANEKLLFDCLVALVKKLEKK